VSKSIPKVALEFAKKLDIPVLDPLLEILDAEFELINKLKDPNAPEWQRIDNWKNEHPQLTKAIEKLVNKPVTTANKSAVIKQLAGITRGGGAGRPARGAENPIRKQTNKPSRSKPTGKTPQKNVVSTQQKAIIGGGRMATKPIQDKHDKEDWKKKKKTKAGVNHPEWYVGKYAPTLVNLNFGTKKDGADYVSGSHSVYNFAPSVAAIGLSLVYPKDETDSFRNAIVTLYTKLRAVNTGTTVYSVDDLTAYVLNVRAVRAVVATLHRYVRAAEMIDIYDAHVPESIIRGASWAAGSYVAVLNNLPALRALGAQLDQQSRSMLPLNLPILDRTEWLFDNIFADSNDVKPQWYEFYIRAIRLFQITATNTYTSVDLDIDSIPDILTVVAPMLSQYMTTYIVNVIAGDMIKAYGTAAIRPLISDWNAFRPLVPVYDEDILQQIENADSADLYTPIGRNVWAPIYSGGNWDNDKWSSNTRFINSVSDATVGYPRTGCYIPNMTWNSVYVNSFRNETSPGQVLSYTRLKFRIADVVFSESDPKTNIVSMNLYTCGSEVVDHIRGIVSDATAIWLPVHANMYAGDLNAEYFPIMSHFDWHPKQYWCSETWPSLSTAWDFKNFAQVSYYDIDRLHQYANYALVEPRYDFAEQGRWAASSL